MPQQEAHSDGHLKPVASDADHWHDWLERLAELRRVSEGDEARCVAATRAMGRRY